MQNYHNHSDQFKNSKFQNRGFQSLKPQVDAKKSKAVQRTGTVANKLPQSQMNKLALPAEKFSNTMLANGVKAMVQTTSKTEADLSPEKT